MKTMSTSLMACWLLSIMAVANAGPPAPVYLRIDMTLFPGNDSGLGNKRLYKCVDSPQNIRITGISVRFVSAYSYTLDWRVILEEPVIGIERIAAGHLVSDGRLNAVAENVPISAITGARQALCVETIFTGFEGETISGDFYIFGEEL